MFCSGCLMTVLWLSECYQDFINDCLYFIMDVLCCYYGFFWLSHGIRMMFFILFWFFNDCLYLRLTCLMHVLCFLLMPYGFVIYLLIYHFYLLLTFLCLSFVLYCLLWLFLRFSELFSTVFKIFFWSSFDFLIFLIGLWFYYWFSLLEHEFAMIVFIFLGISFGSRYVFYWCSYELFKWFSEFYDDFVNDCLHFPMVLLWFAYVFYLFSNGFYLFLVLIW